MDEDDQTGKSAKGRARQTVSDKRQLSGPSTKRKKTNMNIRTAILYRKNFATLIEESVSGTYALFPGVLVYSRGSGNRFSPFLDADLPYRRCRTLQGAQAASLLHLRVLGKLQMQEMCHATLRPRLPGCTRRNEM